MRLFRSHGSVALAALGGLAVGACGLADVFRPGGLKDVVLRYTGATTLNVGTRVAPAVTVEVDGVPMPNPRLRFSSSDTTILALTQIGDTQSTAGHPPSEASENADPDAESLVGVSESSEVFEEGVHV